MTDPLDMTVIPGDGSLGAAIEGVDLATPPGDPLIAALERALLDHVVVCIRDQDFPPAGLVAFGRRFGALEPHVVTQYHHADHPEILVLSNVVENGAPRSRLPLLPANGRLRDTGCRDR